MDDENQGEAPEILPDPPQTRKRKSKVEYPSIKEFALMAVHGMVIRAGPGAFAPNSMLSLEANIAKGYDATCAVIDKIHEQRGA